MTAPSPRRPRGAGAAAPLTVLALLAALLAALPGARADGADAKPPCRPDSVILETDAGAVRYTVEIADEPAEHAQGLMFREEMAEDAGMLFLFAAPRRASFWMRNTFIPLDMIFIGPDGRVLNVEADTVPFSEAPRNSDGDAAAVLEVNAGQAAAQGIGAGTLVRHPALTPEACR
ncbi:MAG: DUF192 domain-containing protein [Pseudomonadota bacterium]